ncbi:hypothetical protein [Synechococcus sp. CS-1328]|uniref:hypothetical protein n=1 Tax=Synechococcus sp. CS-1328 TaxID=2847976 RepID=UPI00223BE7D8|nr:hypothetical protein [Synechococcus sp. CS-1328]MCT0225935.1 hypothetical protein [Synechococcus sp. CS-1328]
MSTQDPRKASSLRRIVLIGLAGWACLLSIESLVRLPGPDPAGALPAQLQRGSLLLPRRPAEPLAQKKPPVALPDGVVERAAVCYGTMDLRLLAHTRSGASGRLPVEAINTAITGSSGGGHCLIVDADGRILAELATEADWMAWRQAHPPTAAQTLGWLLGLRPRQANVCLWTKA